MLPDPRLRGHQADAVAGWNKRNVIAGSNAVFLGDSLRDCDLQLAGDFGHGPYSSKDYFLVKDPRRLAIANSYRLAR